MIATKEFKPKHSRKTIAVVDCETDPFKAGRAVAPFNVGFYDGSIYIDFWGDDCVAQFFAFLKETYAPGDLMIYAHNGGKFDFFFFLPFMDANQFPTVINARLTKLTFAGFEFRDSFAIIPEALGKANKKTKIDYQLFERATREKHKREIRAYLKDDCLDLYALVSRFHEMFGDKLTIGSTALPMLRSFHGYEELSENDDAFFRSFYYGGRVQAFEIGELVSAWRVYDVTSMYPRVMRDFRHPVGASYFMRRDLSPLATFAKIDARNYGALPSRAADGSLSFDVERGTFFATIHEIEAGLETETLEIERVHFSVQFNETTTFAEFVDRFFALRKEAKANGDVILNTFYKLLLNSSYGKFAQDPRDYKDYGITLDGIPADDRGLFSDLENPKGWMLDAMHGPLKIWKAASANPSRAFKNVATAASITGAARAEMLRGIAAATRPVYCDTDSIICENFAGDIGDNLGQWKFEAEGDRVAIGGKKIYALFQRGFHSEKCASHEGKKCSCHGSPKSACKGAAIDAAGVRQIARGEVIEFASPVPNFVKRATKKKEYGEQEFVTRKIRATGKPLLAGNKHVAKRLKAGS